MYTQTFPLIQFYVPKRISLNNLRHSFRLIFLSSLLILIVFFLTFYRGFYRYNTQFFLSDFFATYRFETTGVAICTAVLFIAIWLYQKIVVSVTAEQIVIQYVRGALFRTGVMVRKDEIEKVTIDIYLTRRKPEWNLNDLWRTLCLSDDALGRRVELITRNGLTYDLFMTRGHIASFCDQMRLLGYSAAPTPEEVKQAFARVKGFENFEYKAFLFLAFAIGAIGLSVILFVLVR